MIINFNHPIRSKSIRSYLLHQQQPYWVPIQYREQWFIMTFQYNVYEVVMNE